MDGKIERVVATCAFPKLCPVVTFGAQEGQGSPLPARVLNRLKWQRLCWGTGNTPLCPCDLQCLVRLICWSWRPQTRGLEGGPSIIWLRFTLMPCVQLWLPARLSCNSQSHVAKAQRSLVRCQTNELFLSKCQPAPVSGRQPVMRQGRADKPVVWSETIASIVPLQA